MVSFFKCLKCHNIFIFGTSLKDKTLICGSGCGGELKVITEEEAENHFISTEDITNV